MQAQRKTKPTDHAPARPPKRVLFVALLVLALAAGAVFVALYASASRNASAVAGDVGVIQVIYAQPAPEPLAAARGLAASMASSMQESAAAMVAPQLRREWMEPLRRSTAPTRTPLLIRPTPTAPAPTAPLSPMAAAPPQPAPVASCPELLGQVLTVTLDSQVTVLPITVHIYLPPCYDPQRYAYPTLYLIHGTAFEQGGWLYNGVPRVADVQMSLGVLPPFIIVMPGADMRAGQASKYSWTNTGPGSYDDFFVNELVPYIDEKYSTWASRDGRAIGGISRGGYWAIEIGFAHPDLFSVVGGHSPSVFTKLVGVPPDFSMLSMARSIDELRMLRIWLDAGDQDWARVDMQKLMRDLDEAGVAYYADIGAGGHEDSYWTSRVPEYLAFYSSGWPRVARAKEALGSAAAR